MKFLEKILRCVVLSVLVAACGGGGGGGSGGGNTTAVTYTAGGTVSAAGNSVVDSDVNDINAPYTSNNSIGSPQLIPNPVTLGGYANRAGTGSSGRSYSSGDTDDYFQVELVSGQVITLLIGNTTGDLDLYLYNNSQILAGSSIGTGQTESITVPADGSYFVRVYAYNGYSNYVLSIGQSASSAGAGAELDPDAEFVPGEIIVRFKDEVLKADGIRSVERSASLGLVHKAGSAGRAELMGLGGKENRQRISDRLGILRPAKSMSGVLSVKDEKSVLKRETIEVIKALRKRADVLYADPNYIRRAFAVPNDTYYSYQWHYPLINLPQAWDLTTGSSSVIVAVIDTGALLSHPDLSSRLVSGYDFISSAANALDGDGIDSNPADPGDQGAGGSSFHGTHVAGTIAAATNNGVGVAGIAWGVKIMPVRVLGKNGGTSYDLIQSIKFASGLTNDSGTLPAQAAKIINMSLGGGSFSSSEQTVITQARTAGVIIIAAAGNSNSSTLSYPASYEGVVSVSAVDMQKNRAYYSNYGSKIDVAAPGGDSRVDRNGDGYPDGVLSTLGSDASGSIKYIYGFYQGTSMATPHISGVAALMKSVNSGLTPAQFDSLLTGDTGSGITEDLGDVGRDDYFGYGLIDAYKAVNEAQSLAPGAPLLIVNPSSLNFGASDTPLTLSANNGGGGALTVNSVTDNAAWLGIDDSAADANKLGTYTMTVDRSGLPIGTYTATITFTWSTNTVTVPVIMQVITGSSTADAGYHYILLLDPDTYETKYQLDVGMDNGTYGYQFSSVSSGEYIIIAGSDFNNNFIICEPGEACGAYRTLNDPISVNISSNQSGLDFFSSFDFSFESLSLPDNSGVRGVYPGREIRRIKPN